MHTENKANGIIRCCEIAIESSRMTAFVSFVSRAKTGRQKQRIWDPNVSLNYSSTSVACAAELYLHSNVNHLYLTIIRALQVLEPPALLADIAIVLVRTKRPVTVGTVVRACAYPLRPESFPLVYCSTCSDSCYVNWT
jgi:hypothetical protein